MDTKLNLSKKKLEDIANVLGARLAPFLNKEDLLRRLSPKERLEGLSLEKRLEGLSPEERLEGLSVEEIISVLSDEKRKQLQLLLKTQRK
ncbi:hypothetical protein H8E77_16630 [bacterium]|nr:hypothetical protein [bacterium]